MRARSVRLTIVILFILGLAVAALGFRAINIDLPGLPALDREGAGPLGLKLGLDLSGGGHLVYQADTGSRFDVTLLEPADLQAISAALEGFRFGPTSEEGEELPLEDYQVFPRDVSLVQREVPPAPAVESEDAATPEDGQPADEPPPDREEPEAPPEPEFITVPVASIFQIRTPLLAADDPRRTGLRDAIEESLGQVSLFQVIDIGHPSADQMEGVLGNITKRVNRFGTEEPIIQIFGDDRIIIQLPGASGSTTDLVFAEPADGEAQISLADALTGAGYRDVKVERVDDRSFRILSGTVGSEVESAAYAAVSEAVAPIQSFTVNSAIDEAKDLIGKTALLEFRERTCGSLDPLNGACLDPTDADLGLTGDDLERAEAAADPVGVGWVVNLQFNGRGSGIFSDLTRRIAGVETKRIAVFMDDQEIIAPVARAWIRDGSTQISGDFTRDDARTLAIQLESGRLQVPLKLIQESDVGPHGGAEALRNSLWAGLVGLGLVLLFVIAYYRMAGVVAAFAPGVLRRDGAGSVQTDTYNPRTGPRRRFHLVHWNGGGRQHTDIRADEGRSAHRADAGVIHGSGVQPGMACHPRFQHFDDDYVLGAAVVRRPAGRRAGHGRRHQPVHRRGRQYVHCGGGEPQPAATAGLRGTGAAD